MRLHECSGSAGGAVTGFDNLDAVLCSCCTRAIEVVDEQLRGAANGATADHQAVGGSAIACQHAIQAQGAVVTGVIALNGQAALSVVATTQVDGAGVDYRYLAVTLDADDAALTAVQRAACIDLQGPGPSGRDHAWLIAAQVSQCKGVVEGEPAALLEVDGLPVHVRRTLADLTLLECQCVRAGTAVQDNGRVAQVEGADDGGVIVILHDDPLTDLATRPGKFILAVASAYFAFERAAADGDLVNAATGTDITADGAARHDDRVVAKPTDNVANNNGFDTEPLGNLEEVVSELEIDSANAAAFEPRRVSIFKSACDGAAGHGERVHVTALVQ
ncbi:hypothetical protein D3C80_917160 [compost metagenome]